MRYLRILTIGAVVMLTATTVRAAPVTGLAVVCSDSKSAGLDSCGGTRTYDYPAGKVVKTETKWQKFDSLSAATKILVCSQAVEPGAAWAACTSRRNAAKSEVTASKPVATEEVKEIEVTWTAAGTYTDGTVIPSTLVSTFSVYRGATASALTKLIAGVACCGHKDTGLSDGTYYYAVTQTVGGVESDKSAVVSYSLTAGTVTKTPAAPTIK